MVSPTLEETTRNAINGLRIEELRLRTSYGLYHEILQYGLDAVAHAYVIRMAGDVVRGDLSVSEFVQKYQIIPAREGSKLRCRLPLKVIKTSGIFVPEHRINHSCGLFSYDYFNKFDRGSDILPKRLGKKCFDEAIENACLLIYGDWPAERLGEASDLNRGLKFAQDLWTISVDGFERHQEGLERLGIDKIERQKYLGSLGRRLIDYYGQVLNLLPDGSRFFSNNRF